MLLQNNSCTFGVINAERGTEKYSATSVSYERHAAVNDVREHCNCHMQARGVTELSITRCKRAECICPMRLHENNTQGKATVAGVL